MGSGNSTAEDLNLNTTVLSRKRACIGGQGGEGGKGVGGGLGDGVHNKVLFVPPRGPTPNPSIYRF